MALIQAARPGGSGGGGGITIYGFQVDTYTVTENFTAGSLVIPLTETPVSDESIDIDYNGQKLLYVQAWTYDSGTNSITIEFADPYVTDYDANPYFQIQYPY